MKYVLGILLILLAFAALFVPLPDGMSPVFKAGIFLALFSFGITCIVIGIQRHIRARAIALVMAEPPRITPPVRRTEGPVGGDEGTRRPPYAEPPDMSGGGTPESAPDRPEMRVSRGVILPPPPDEEAERPRLRLVHSDGRPVELRRRPRSAKS